MRGLAPLLHQRLQDVSGMNLQHLVSAEPRLQMMSGALRHLWHQSRPALGTESPSHWAGLMTRGMVRFLTDQFQYIDIAGGDERLETIYERFATNFLAATTLDDAEVCLVGHQARLRSWVAEKLDAVGALELVREDGFRPVCALYSPDVQLRLLGLAVDGIRPPVLDLGCGDGRLVNYLRSRGVSAVGVDRNGDPSKGIVAEDWFRVGIGRQRWGTIIAHQSVSLHFVNAHLHSPARGAAYARLLVRMAHGLKPGGTLAYAPSLPFFDHLLRSDFVVHNRQYYGGVWATQVICEGRPD